MNQNEEIIEALKNARQEKGLSQQELGHRVGVPQSHISKIEKGGVDIQLSSLVQIARALDLEIKLVPKKALPAVESIVAGFPRDRTAPALSEIRKLQKQLDRVADTPLSQDVLAPLEKLNSNLKSLQALSYDTDAFVRLRKTLDSISQLGVTYDQLERFNKVGENHAQLSKHLKNLNRASDNLRKLRNSLAHRYEQEDLLDRPAYSLEGNDE